LDSAVAMSCLTHTKLLDVIGKESDLCASQGRHEVDRPRKLRGELKTAYDHLAVCDDCWELYVPLVTAERDRVLARLREPPRLPQIENCVIIRPVEPLTANPVYKAWWTPEDPAQGEDRRRLVALKLIGNSVLAQVQLDALYRIRDPHVARCRAIDTSGSSFWACVDWIDGEHLDVYVQTAKISLAQRLRLFEQICQAVGAAHRNNIIHRDLKPSNIIVNDDGYAYLIDFDVSKHDAADKDAPVQQWGPTPKGFVRGTPGYMAPEQLSGGPTTPATDIWGLGVNLYITVTQGEHPLLTPELCDDRPEDLKKLVASGCYRFKPLSFEPEDKEGVDSAEAKLEQVIWKCTRFRPQDRYQSTDALADVLRRCREGIPLGSTSRWERSRESYYLVVRNHPRRVHAVFAAFALFLVFLFGKAFDVGWQVRDANEFVVGASGRARTAIEWTRDRILVVAIDEEADGREATRQAVKRYADQRGIEPPVDPNDYRTWRPVHGDLMKQLAAAEPLAVVFDVYFPTPQPGDAEFVAGAKALLERGIPLVVGTRTIQKSGDPALSPTIAGPLGEALHSGHVLTAERKPSSGGFRLEIVEGRLSVAAQAPGGRVCPSLSLATRVALLHPRERLDSDLIEGAKELLPKYRPGSTSQPVPRQRVPWLDDGAAIPLHATYVYPRPDPRVPMGTLFSDAQFDLQDRERWRGQTVRYEDALAMSRRRLSEKVQGRIVIVGDVTTSDIHLLLKDELYGNRRTNGCYLHADALCGLLAAKYRAEAFPFLYFLPVKWTLMMSVCAALAGGLMAAAFRPDRAAWANGSLPNRAAALTVVALVCVLSLVAMARSTSWGLAHVSLAVAAFAFAFMPLHWSNTAAARWLGTAPRPS